MKNLSKKKIDDFFTIMKENKIHSVFQPIVSLKTGEVLGYEALSRITLEETDLNIEEVFNMSEQLGYLYHSNEWVAVLRFEDVFLKSRQYAFWRFTV